MLTFINVPANATRFASLCWLQHAMAILLSMDPTSSFLKLQENKGTVYHDSGFLVLLLITYVFPCFLINTFSASTPKPPLLCCSMHTSSNLYCGSNINGYMYITLCVMCVLEEWGRGKKEERDGSSEGDRGRGEAGERERERERETVSEIQSERISVELPWKHVKPFNYCWFWKVTPIEGNITQLGAV